jgi:hypothetical protein
MSLLGQKAKFRSHARMSALLLPEEDIGPRSYEHVGGPLYLSQILSLYGCFTWRCEWSKRPIASVKQQDAKQEYVS